jgi:hypothetical protein
LETTSSNVGQKSKRLGLRDITYDLINFKMFKSLRPIRSNFYIIRRMSTKNDNLNIPGLLAEEHKSLKNMIEADN